jgi:hypothetical protein
MDALVEAVMLFAASALLGAMFCGGGWAIERGMAKVADRVGLAKAYARRWRD